MNVKICDLGFATKDDLVASFVGTRGYLSPEQLKREVHDPKQADIFSLGIVLYTLRTCCFPFKKADIDDEIYSYISHDHYDLFWNQCEFLH